MNAETNEKCKLCCDMQAVGKFYCLRGKTSTKVIKKMKPVYGNNCLSRTQVFALHKEFLEERETAELRNSNIVDDHQHYVPKLKLTP